MPPIAMTAINMTNLTNHFLLQSRRPIKPLQKQLIKGKRRLYHQPWQTNTVKLTTSKTFKKTPLVCAISLIGYGMLPLFAHASDDNDLLDLNHTTTHTTTSAQDSALDSLALLSQYYMPNEPPNPQAQFDNPQTNPYPSAISNKVDNTANHVSQKIQSWINADSSLCGGQWVYPSNVIKSINNIHDVNATQANDQATALHTQADYGYYDSVRYATLTGNVTVQQGNQLIQADKVLVDVQTQNTTAHGNVLFVDMPTDLANTANATNADAVQSHTNQTRQNLSNGGLITVAKQIEFNNQSQTAHANDVAFANIGLQAHGYAKSLSKSSDNHIALTDVMFTTCPPTDPKWRLQATTIELDDKSGRGVAHNARLKIGNVPVIYLPYFNFPIDDRRASGFLLPSVSLRNDGQAEIQTPYYANLAANIDATLTPRIFSDRNPMMSAEIRYLHDDLGYSQIQGDYLPNDRQYYKQNRKSLFAKHLWQSKHIDNLTGEAVYQYVSDPNFIDDFEVFGKAIGSNNLNQFDNNAHLPRSAQLNYFNEYINANLKAETYQNLDVTDAFGNPATDALNPYSKLPQLTANYVLPLDQLKKTNNNIKLIGVHDSGYFQKNITDRSAPEKSGFRMYNKLTASYPMHNAWGYAVPSVSLQQLFARYDESTVLNNQINKEDRQQGILLPSVALDTGIYLKKIGSPFGWFDNIKNHKQNGHQLLSPRIKYTYTPFKDQNNLPNFNTSIASLSYDQLFADSWFLGHDRIQDLHAITPAINYRYIDNQGNTRLDIGIAQQFYLDEGKTRLSDFISNPNSQNNLQSDTNALFNKRSGLVTSIQAQPIEHLWWHVNIANKQDHSLNFLTSQLRYQPTDNSMISLGIVNRQADRNTNQLPLKAYTTSLILPFNQNWRLMAQGQFDNDRKQITDGLLGINFQDCCIGASVYVRRHINELNVNAKPDNALMAELRLTGLSPKSGRFNRLLQNKIYGFTSVQNSWVK